MHKMFTMYEEVNVSEFRQDSQHDYGKTTRVRKCAKCVREGGHLLIGKGA